MKKYKITYNTDSCINKTIQIKARGDWDALYLFLTNHPEANEVVNIEEVI